MDKALKFVKSISEEELNFISLSDYGNDSERHKEALKKLIFEQDCVVSDEQFWYPYEVVELARWECKTGHEREFAICNIIIALSIIAGEDTSNDVCYMIDNNAQEYDKLPVDIKELVLNILTRANGVAKC